MLKNSVPTCNATIYCGLNDGYNKPLGNNLTVKRNLALGMCQEYVDEVGLCVTIKDTMFVYKGGFEPGLEVGLINYARFPQEPSAIRKHATTLGERLMKAMGQHRVSVVTSIETILLENEELKQHPEPALLSSRKARRR